jgi:hypothetical protein
MKNEIQKYEPMRQVTMKDGRLFFYPQKKDNAMQAALKTDAFVTIEGVTVNKFEIKYIEDLSNDHDVLFGLTEDQRNKAITKFKQYEANLGKKPTKEWRINWIKIKLLNTI